MGVTALVMAGGKGTRMQIREEKPLIKVCGKPVIEYVIAALQHAKKINRIIVATSACTPKTAHHLSSFPVQVVETPGQRLCFGHGLCEPKPQTRRFLSYRG